MTRLSRSRSLLSKLAAKRIRVLVIACPAFVLLTLGARGAAPSLLLVVSDA